MARKRTRAARRIVERTAKNAAARAAGAEVAEDAPRRKRRYSYHRSQIERLEARGCITPEQKWAADRLYRDWRASDSQIGRLVASYAPGSKPPRKYQMPPPDAPAVIAARERFEAALAHCGEFAAILVHVVITDEPASTWRANGKAEHEGDRGATGRVGRSVVALRRGSP